MGGKDGIYSYSLRISFLQLVYYYYSTHFPQKNVAFCQSMISLYVFFLFRSVITSVEEMLFFKLNFWRFVACLVPEEQTVFF